MRHKPTFHTSLTCDTPQNNSSTLNSTLSELVVNWIIAILIYKALGLRVELIPELNVLGVNDIIIGVFKT
jgi:hypothetical protein